VIAGSWLLPDVTSARRFQGTHEERCLNAFRYALLEFLNNAQAVRELAATIRPMPVGGAISVGVAATDARKVVLDASTLTPRPELLESCLRVLITTGRVCLVGELGTGKSALATMLAKAASPDEEPILLRHHQFMENVVETLESHGIPTHGSDVAVLLRDLARLLEAAASTRLVIVDNLDDWRLLDTLVSDKTLCRVVVTSNRRPSDKWDRHVVDVPDMTPDEARAMALSLAPRLSEEEAERLGATLRYRPIAIAQTCRYLEKNRAATTAMLQGVIDRRMSLALETIADSTEQNLKLIHAATIKELQETYPAAVRLLEVLSFGQELTSRRGHIDYAEQVCYMMLGLGLTPEELETGLLVHAKSVQVLQERYLIKVGYLSGWMHAVTAAVFRDLLRAETERIAGQLLEVSDAAMHGYYIKVMEIDEPAKGHILRLFEDTLPPDMYQVLLDGLREAQAHKDEKLVRIMHSLAPAQGYLFKKVVFDGNVMNHPWIEEARRRAAVT
jgi:ABC-type dipeptide/oligopeptide/nickel transport system ATPase subunit